MAYQIKTTGAFERDFKRCEKRGLPMEELRTVMKILAENGCLPEEYKPHKLVGNRRNQWECHIRPNWLLIWEQHDLELILIMLNTGSHSDVFGKTRR